MLKEGEMGFQNRNTTNTQTQTCFYGLLLSKSWDVFYNVCSGVTCQIQAHQHWRLHFPFFVSWQVSSLCSLLIFSIEQLPGCWTLAIGTCNLYLWDSAYCTEKFQIYNKKEMMLWFLHTFLPSCSAIRNILPYLPTQHIFLPNSS